MQSSLSTAPASLTDVVVELPPTTPAPTQTTELSSDERCPVIRANSVMLGSTKGGIRVLFFEKPHTRR